jgi:hypothetical protein
MNTNVLFSNFLTKNSTYSSNDQSFINSFLDKSFENILSILNNPSILSNPDPLLLNRANTILFIVENLMLPLQNLPIMSKIIPINFNSVFLFYLFAIQQNQQILLIMNNAILLQNINHFLHFWNNVHTIHSTNIKLIRQYVIFLKNLFESFTDIDFIQNIKDLFSFITSLDQFNTLSSSEKEMYQEFTLLSIFFQQDIHSDYNPIFFEIFILFFILSHFIPTLFPSLLNNPSSIPNSLSSFKSSLNTMKIIPMYHIFESSIQFINNISSITSPPYYSSLVDMSTNVQTFLNMSKPISEVIYMNPGCLSRFIKSGDEMFIPENDVFTLLKNYSFHLSIDSTKKVSSVNLITNISPIFAKYYINNLLVSSNSQPLFTIEKKAEQSAIILSNVDQMLRLHSQALKAHSEPLRFPEGTFKGGLCPPFPYMSLSTIKINNGYDLSLVDAKMIEIEEGSELDKQTTLIPTTVRIIQEGNQIQTMIDNQKELLVNLLQENKYGIYKGDQQIGEGNIENADNRKNILFTFSTNGWNYTDMICLCYIFYILLSM